MLKNKKIAVVVPCYNEQSQISNVIRTMPDYIDDIVIIDDNSRDDTVKIVEKFKQENNRIVLLKHLENQGVGGAIATGYKWARDNEVDIAVAVEGDPLGGDHATRDRIGDFIKDLHFAGSEFQSCGSLQVQGGDSNCQNHPPDDNEYEDYINVPYNSRNRRSPKTGISMYRSLSHCLGYTRVTITASGFQVILVH